MPSPLFIRRLMGGVALGVFLNFTLGIPSDYTPARASNATMHDSVGTLVFAENQLLTSTDDLTVANSWETTEATINDADKVTLDSGTNARIIQRTSGVKNADAIVAGGVYDIIFEAAKTSAGDTIVVEIAYFDSVAGFLTGSDITLTTTFQTISLIGLVPLSSTSSQVQLLGATGNTGGQVQVRNMRMVRTPMVGGSVFIPNTTTSSFYGARAPSYVFDGSDWLNEGYLTEEARTNLWLQSKAFGTSPNSLVRAAIGTGVVGPDGVNTTTALIANADEDTSHILQQSWTEATITDNAIHTLSVFAKKGAFDWILLQTKDKNNSNLSTYFDLDNGVVGATAAHDDQGIIDVDNGWFLCWVIVDVVTGVTNPTGLIYLAEANGDAAFTGDASTIQTYIDDVQFEEGQGPSSRIPTVLTTLERAADTLLKGTSGVILPEINYLAGEIVVEFMANPGSLATGSSQNLIDVVSDALASDKPKIQIFESDVTAGNINARIRLAGSDKLWTPATSNTSGTRHKVGMAWDANGGISSFDGVTGGTEPAFTPESGFDIIGWGHNAITPANGGYSGHIRSGFLGKTKPSQAAHNARTA